MMDITPSPSLDENNLIAERRAKLRALKAEGFSFPNTFRREHFSESLHQQYAHTTGEHLEEEVVNVKVAGRMMLKRVMGKASFATLQDMEGRIQIYIQKEKIGEEAYEAFKHYDLGDILGVRGHLFRTKTGELSVRAEEVLLLTKSLRPLPEKFHGLQDTEQKYRQRYLDLMTNPETQTVFRLRSQIVQYIRQFFVERGYLEVETPMMHVIPGGASAKPFVTHHNALDMPLFLRIAPELYLKRLVVGGIEKVFEINRNFRNEGLSTRHNPEFTMIEFYEAYQDYHYLMDLTETLIRGVTQHTRGTTVIDYQGHTIDLGQRFARFTLAQAIHHYHPECSLSQLEDPTYLSEAIRAAGETLPTSRSVGALQLALFEAATEQRLIQPTFIIDYPWEVSPLARRSSSNPAITDRFELFIVGRELANGFSELNDAEDQAERFQDQVRQKTAGDDEAMHYDADYVRALEFGLPPTAGEGIGIDRLVMLLTNSPSIRDVILFPHMRPSQES
jgi:lysyl-tRNA synthetase, class II